MIGGNVDGVIQVRTTFKNAIGEAVKSWADVQTLHGWLDYSSGDSKYTNFNAKIQESSHIFICDYVVLDSKIKAENSRMIVNNAVYDVVMIDNPMGLNQHYEIYLNYTGGQS